MKHNYKDGSLVLELHRDEERGIFRITNTGPVLPLELCSRVFERFLRGDASHGSAIEGSGLGLSIALATYEASKKKSQTAATLSQEAAAASGTTKRMVDAGEFSLLELTRRQIEASTAILARMAADIEAQTAAGALEDAMQARL